MLELAGKEVTSGAVTNTQTYKVPSGDTLSSIAPRFNTTVIKLVVANDNGSNLIQAGQRQVFPKAGFLEKG